MIVDVGFYTGKSSVGNIIIGSQFFSAHFRERTKECKLGERQFHDKLLRIVDTPELSNHERTKLMDGVRALGSTSQAILLVTSCSCEPDIDCPESSFQLLEEIFGTTVVQKRIIAVFTHFDDVIADKPYTTIDEYLKENPHLQKLVDLCSGRYVDGSRLSVQGDSDSDAATKQNEIVQRLLNIIQTMQPDPN